MTNLISYALMCQEYFLMFCNNFVCKHFYRDIKCDNLLMDHHFNIKLSDFGFARDQIKTKKGEWLLSTTYCGSYAYASPEILRGIPYQPQLSDIWSMGVVLYTMVYGRLPFDDTNHAQLLKVFRYTPGPIYPMDSIFLYILILSYIRCIFSYTNYLY